MEKLLLRLPLFKDFQKLKASFAVSALAIGLLSCQGGSVTPVSGIDSNDVVGGSFSQHDSSKISGTGALKFNQNATSTRHALTLQGSLDEAHNGSLTAHFYSNSASLAANSGITIQFLRSGASVLGSIRVNGATYQISAARLNFYYPASLDVIIEVHNTAPARVLIWRRDVGIYSADTADVDTNRSGDLVSGSISQSGPGIFVGLVLNLATVSVAKSTTPQVLN